jgi:hypothetical protein
MIYTDHVSKINIENGFFDFVDVFPNFSEYFIWSVNHNYILRTFSIRNFTNRAEKILLLKDYWNTYEQS